MRLDSMEAELREARQRAASAEAKLEAQDAARRVADDELKRSLDSIRRTQEDSHSRGRIESLEGRLDAIGERLMAALGQPSTDPAQTARIEGIERRLEEMSGARTDARFSRIEAALVELKGVVESLGGARADERARELERSLEGLKALFESLGGVRAEERASVVEASLTELKAMIAPLAGWRSDERARDIESAIAGVRSLVESLGGERADERAQSLESAIGELRKMLVDAAWARHGERFSAVDRGLESVVSRLEALEKLFEGARQGWEAAPGLSEKLSGLAMRLEGASKGQEREAEALSELRVELLRALARLPEPADAAKRILSEMEQRGAAILAEITAVSEKARQAAQDVAEACARAQDAARVLTDRQDITDRTAELLERQRAAEKKVEDALALLRAKDELLSRLSKELVEKLKPGS